MGFDAQPDAGSSGIYTCTYTLSLLSELLFNAERCRPCRQFTIRPEKLSLFAAYATNSRGIGIQELESL